MSNPVLSGFTSLGDAFAQKLAPLFSNFQNSSQPNVKPTNTNTFSFDFAGGFMNGLQALIKPFQTVTDPKAAAASNIIGTTGNAISALIGAGANKAIDLIGNLGNKKNDIGVTVGTTATNPVPSQNTGFSLSDLLSVFNSGNGSPAAPVSGDYVAAEAAKNSQNSMLLIGGIALIGVFLVTAGKGK
jgi:hypothetical protein